MSVPTPDSASPVADPTGARPEPMEVDRSQGGLVDPRDLIPEPGEILPPGPNLPTQPEPNTPSGEAEEESARAEPASAGLVDPRVTIPGPADSVAQPGA